MGQGSDLESCQQRPHKFLTGSQSRGFVGGKTGSAGEIHSPCWRKGMIASERKNGDRFLFGDKDEKGSSAEEPHGSAGAPGFLTYHMCPT